MPVLSGRAPRISRTTRITCFWPFFGGTSFSISSVARIRPTRSLFLIALNAHSAPTSAASRALLPLLRAEALARREVDDEHHRHLALFDEDLDEGLVHARADVPVDVRTSSPGWYCAHLAEAQPLTLEDRDVVARELLGGQPIGRDLDLAQRLEQLLVTDLESCVSRSATIRGSDSSRHFDDFEHAAHDVLGRDLLGLGLVAEHDAVAQHVGADRLDVLRGDVAAVAQERVRARREVERDAGARAARRIRSAAPDPSAPSSAARASRTRRRRCSP